MITKTLTGRIRHRAINLMFKPTLLVLQVEEHQRVDREDDDIGPISSIVDRKVWRDALVEDMTTLGELPETDTIFRAA